MIFSHYQLSHTPWPTPGSGVRGLDMGSNSCYPCYNTCCMCAYVYIIYSCIYTYTDTSTPSHPPADISRPQIGPDFRGFGVFSWIAWCVTCCYTYVIHTYTPHIPCIYVRMYVICCISCSSHRHQLAITTPNTPWVPPTARIQLYVHILAHIIHICISYGVYRYILYMCNNMLNSWN